MDIEYLLSNYSIEDVIDILKSKNDIDLSNNLGTIVKECLIDNIDINKFINYIINDEKKIISDDIRINLINQLKKENNASFNDFGGPKYTLFNKNIEINTFEIGLICRNIDERKIANYLVAHNFGFDINYLFQLILNKNIYKYIPNNIFNNLSNEFKEAIVKNMSNEDLKEALKENVSLIRYIDSSFDKELTNIALNNGYNPSIEEIKLYPKLQSNYYILNNIINNGHPEIIEELIDKNYLFYELLGDMVIIDALYKGYEINDNTFKNIGIDNKNKNPFLNFKNRKCISNVLLEEAIITGNLDKYKDKFDDYLFQESHIMILMNIIENNDYSEETINEFLSYINVFSVINYKVLNLFLDKEYNPKISFFRLINNYVNKEITKKLAFSAIEKNANCIKYYQGNDEEIYKYALDKGYIPNSDDLKNYYSLCKSREIMLNAINRDVNLIIYYKENNEDIYKYAIDKGYVPNSNDLRGNNYLSSSKVIIKNAVDIDISMINYYNGNDEEIFKYAINKNSNSIKYIQKQLNEEIYKYAIDKGYIPNADDLKNNKYLAGSKSIIMKSMEIDVNFIKYYQGNDEETFKYAIDKGYIPSKEDLLNNIYLSNSKVIIESAIESNPDLISLYTGFDTEGLGELYFNKKNIDFSNMDIYKREFFNELNSRVGNDKYYIACIYKQIFELNPDLYKKVDIDFLYMIIKYICFSLDNSKEFLTEIIKNNNFDNLIQVYNFYKKGSNDIDFFKNIVLVYPSISNLCNTIVNENYEFADLKNLYSIIINGNKQGVELNTITDLRNYKNNIYNSNMTIIKKSVVNGYDVEEIKNRIFLLLLNNNYSGMGKLLKTTFNTTKIKSLIDNIKDKKTIYELENYLVFMELVENIYNMNDVQVLKNILFNLNERYLNEDENIKRIWDEFRNIENVAKSFYAIELSEKTTDFANIKNQDGIIIESNKYKSTIDSVDGEIINRKEVDYIELDGISFVTFGHALNGFGEGGKITDFKHPRLIGKSYICLSAIDDENYGVVDRIPYDINHVTLLFSKISNNQLVYAADHDIYSRGGTNSRKVSATWNYEFKPVRDVISNTHKGLGGYNEYVMYREDDNGNSIYPSAILVVGDEPVEAEIDAAAYLGIPLVKINKSKYQKDSIIIENKSTRKNAEFNSKRIEEYRKLKATIDSLKKMIYQQELEGIEERSVKNR